MQILIVEDMESMAHYIGRLMKPIRDEFPGSTVTTVATFDAAMEIISEINPPDIVLLDLTLPPLSPAETIARLHEIEDRSPVVIVTGHPKEHVEKLLGEHQAEVVYKTDMLKGSGVLFRAILRAVEKFCGESQTRQRYASLYARIDTLKQLADAPS